MDWEALFIWLSFMVPTLAVLTVAGWFADTKAGMRLAAKIDRWLQ